MVATCLAWVAGAPCAAQTAPRSVARPASNATPTFDRATAAEALRRIKCEDWPRAYREQDLVLLDRLLASEFESIDEHGAVADKADELAWLRRNALSLDAFVYTIHRLDVFDNGTAIVSGEGDILDDGSRTRYRSTNVFLHRDGRWQAIASHVSGVRSSPEVARSTDTGRDVDEDAEPATPTGPVPCRTATAPARAPVGHRTDAFWRTWPTRPPRSDAAGQRNNAVDAQSNAISGQHGTPTQSLDAIIARSAARGMP